MKKINSLEYYTLIWFSIRACFPELTFTIILHMVKEDSWISIILGTIFGILPFLVYEKIREKDPKETLITINKKIFPKTGKLINIIILISCLTSAIYTFWIIIKFTNELFLYKTSNWIISLILIIPIWYTSSKDIHIISKVSLILFYISVSFQILITFGLISNIDINALKPILQNTTKNIAHSSLLYIALNISKLFFLTIIPIEKIKKYSFKKNIIVYLITNLAILNIIIATICTFGIDLSLIYEYPAFQVLKRVKVLGIFDKVESILAVEAIFSLFIQIIIIIYYIKKIIEKEIIKKANKYTTILICLSLLISNNIFKTYKAEENFLNNYLIYLIYPIFIVIPIITYIKTLYIQNSKESKLQGLQ